MTILEKQILILKTLAGKYAVYVESYPKDAQMTNMVYASFSNDNQLTFYLCDDDSITIASDFPTKDDELLDKNTVEEILNMFESSQSPFDYLGYSDEHNGIVLVKEIKESEIKQRMINDLANYLDKPNEFLNRLIDVTRNKK